MPEYLAPGVYVEEVDTGNKPIEGVSTSTAGVVGVTERGPVGVPIFITSYGEFERIFGGKLNRLFYPNPHNYLPHAVEGFFTNGGQRLYVVRTLDTVGAVHALTRLFNRGEVTLANPTPANTRLLRGAAEGSSTSGSPPLLYILDTSDLSADDWFRIGNGSHTEYRRVLAIPGSNHVPIDLPLLRSHDAGATAEQFTPANSVYPAALNFALVSSTQPEDQSIIISDPSSANVTQLSTDATSVNGHLLAIGDPNQAEYRFAIDATIDPLNPNQIEVQLDIGLAISHDAGATITPLDMTLPAPATPESDDLETAATAGSTVIFVNDRAGAFDTKTDLVVIDSGNADLRQVRRIGTLGELDISTGAYEKYNAASIINTIQMDDEIEGLPARQIITNDPAIGDTIISMDNVTDLQSGQILRVGAAGNEEDVVIDIGTPDGLNPPQGDVTFITQLQNDHAINDPVVRLIVHFLTVEADATSSIITLNSRVNLARGQVLQIGDPPDDEYITIDEVPGQNPTQPPDPGNVVLNHPLNRDLPVGTPVYVQQVPTVALETSPARQIIAPDPSMGDSTITINDIAELEPGHILRIGAAGNEEDVVIDTVTPDAGNPPQGDVTFTTTLQNDHALNDPLVGVIANAAIVLDTASGDDTIVVTDGSGYVMDTFIEVRTPTNEVFYHRLSSAFHEAENIGQIEIYDPPLNHSHAINSLILGQESLIDIQALDAGIWGDRLRVAVEDEREGLVENTYLRLVNAISNPVIKLDSSVGVEPGTVLELRRPDGTVVGPLLKVNVINRRTGEIILAGTGLDGTQMTELNLNTLQVRSREFRVTVYLLRQPNLAVPTRNETVLDSELFRHLSLDPRHSRYIETIIGSITGELREWDRRPEGQSQYIRVRDIETNDGIRESIRLGPDLLVDLLPTGQEAPGHRSLIDGFDSLGTIFVPVNHYVGKDAPEPENRTGIYSLKNYEDISLIGSPGQTRTDIQQALIQQCESMRFRFSVIDGPPPPGDTLTDVRLLRQQYDTKYAALYHPWVQIWDPNPQNLAEIKTFAIPASGHLLGVYARTDIERGVHKAPANEVVRGILGLQRILNKGEHDILNPVNINVIRDFRPNNRGIRVWGGRVITSDPDWKYVSVRRLIIFIESSIERGLQWVVFEPNAEPLWARVTRTISNFLTTLWRNGALEGTKTEEAFFVKCDRTTMTQTDIDNGRLICVIGVAPVKPAEFVIVRIGLWTAFANDNQ